LSEPVAVTGIGMTTCLGAGVEANWRRLREGRSGIGRVTRFDTSGYPVERGGEAPAPAGGADGGVDLEILHLLGAIREACAAAGLAGGRLPAPERTGVVIGSSLAGSASAERFFAEVEEKGTAAADYGILDGYYIEEELGRICGELGACGPALLVSNACAAGGSSLAAGARWIAGGRADLVLAAGYDPLSIFTFAGFGSLLALSPTAIRPFSRNRDGMLLGDGFAAMVLERAAPARRAGRRILGWLSGYGESTDAHHLTHPHPQGAGAALAMRRALARASLRPEDIDYVNCHGTGTRPNDLAESRALRGVFGDRLRSLPLSSSKPFFGHTLGGAGAVEAAVTLLALLHGFLPANLDYDLRDPELEELDVVVSGRPAAIRHAMSNNFGFGGSNTSLIFSRDEEEG
jgi:3-oxoacyl-[acyl-carrier-protein] synthase II